MEIKFKLSLVVYLFILVFLLQSNGLPYRLLSPSSFASMVSFMTARSTSFSRPASNKNTFFILLKFLRSDIFWLNKSLLSTALDYPALGIDLRLLVSFFSLCPVASICVPLSFRRPSHQTTSFSVFFIFLNP